MKKFSRVFYIMSLANFLFFMGNSFFILLPLFLKDLGASESYIGIMNNIDKAFIIAGSAVVASLMHRGGRLAILRSGYIVLILTFLSYALISSLTPLISVIRIFHGFGFSMVAILGSMIVFESVPHESAAEAIGIYGVTGAVTNAASPAIGEYLSNNGVSYDVIFIISAGFVAAALAASFFMNEVHASGENKKEISERGMLRLFRERTFLVYSIICFVFGGGFGVLVTFFPNFVKTTAGLNFSSFFIVYILVLIIVRFTLVKKFNSANKTVLVSSMLALGGLMNMALGSADSYPVLYALAAAYGVTHGALYPVLNAHMLEIVISADRGKANSAYIALFTGGMMIFSIVLGFAIDFFSSYKAAFYSCGAAFILAAILCAVSDGGRKQQIRSS